MTASPTSRIVLRLAAIGVLAFIYLPLIVIGIHAFNASTNQAWPISGLSLQWFERAFEQSGVQNYTRPQRPSHRQRRGAHPHSSSPSCRSTSPSAWPAPVRSRRARRP